MTAPNVVAFDESSWPREAGFIDPTHLPAVNVRIARRGLRDVGLRELPKGSNSSPRIVRYLTEAGVPLSVIRSGKGYWCAAQAGAVFRDAGAKVPTAYASCQNWYNWAVKNGYLHVEPIVGAMVLYGANRISHHCGIVLHCDQGYMVDIEGNTSLNGYSREGLLCGIKDIALDKVLGYVWPTEAP